MEIFVIMAWLLLAIFCGVYASNKGRSGIGFFFLALLLSPLVGFIVAFAVATNTKEIEQKSVESGKNKKCPFCAELIKVEAKICRYCGKELPEPSKEESIKSKIKEELKDPEEAMKKYGIKYHIMEGRYSFEGYKYADLEDAIAYAKQNSATRQL